MRTLVRHRFSCSAVLALVLAVYLQQRIGLPDPAASPLLASIFGHDPTAYYTLRGTWFLALLGVPMLYCFLPAFSFVYRVMRLDAKKVTRVGSLPPYPAIRSRKDLFAVLGEQHLLDKQGPAERPEWLTIPSQGLVLGVLALGSPGTGKTAGVVTAIAEQLFGWCADDSRKKVGGLVLEVKGDLCPRVKRILTEYSRAEDYIEISFDSPYVWNPLDSEDSPNQIAFNLVAIMTALRGGRQGGDPFWDAASSSLIAYLVTLHRIVHSYVTLYDLRIAAADMTRIERMMEEAAASLVAKFIVISKTDFAALPDKLTEPAWTDCTDGVSIRTPFDEELLEQLKSFCVVNVEDGTTAPGYAERLDMYHVASTFFQELKAMDNKLVTSVAKGLTTFLDFAAEPQARRIFSPVKEAFDAIANRDGRYGLPLPPLSQMVETSRVIALSLPVAADEAFARISASLIKFAWQKAMLQRIPKMQAHPEQYFRHQALLIDEYDKVVPGKDGAYLNQCRAAKCIPVVALQTLSQLKASVGDSWDVIFSAFATTIVLRQKSVFSAKEISAAVGREDMIRDSYGLAENAADANVSWSSGRTVSQQSSMNLSHGFNVARDFMIEPKQLMELPLGTAVALANDGTNQLTPRFCYLKPHGQDPNVGYFQEPK